MAYSLSRIGENMVAEVKKPKPKPKKATPTAPALTQETTEASTKSRKLKRIYHYSEREALDFFARLWTYSAEYVRRIIPTIQRNWPSTNNYSDWTHGTPVGNVLHWTAGVRFTGTIRHFVLGQRASANWVLAKFLEPSLQLLRRDLGLEADLQVEVCEVVPPTKPSWHAGWVNRLLTGMELRNAGFLRPSPRGRLVGHLHAGISVEKLMSCDTRDPEELDWYWWPEYWTTPFPWRDEVVKLPCGIWAERWSRAQLATVVTVLRYLNSAFPGKLMPEWMFAHHCCYGGKFDIRLGLPAQEVTRSALFSNQHVDDLDWLCGFDGPEVDDQVDVDDPLEVEELDLAQAERADEDIEGEVVDVDGDVDCPYEVQEALEALGFWVQGDLPSARVVRTYQRGRGLTVDGVAGGQTRAELTKELRKWKLIG